MNDLDPLGALQPLPAPNVEDLRAVLFGSDDDLEYKKLASRKRAELRWREEVETSSFSAPPRTSLRELRDNPPPAITWTIDRLAAKGSTVFSLGTFKSGKSSLTLNILRSLADQVPFLGAYAVREIEGTIGYFDFEMGTTETYDRLDRMGCVNDDKIYIYDMAGCGFDITSETSYSWLRREINEANMEAIVLDAVRHIAKRKDGNSDSETQAIVDRLDRLKKECTSLQDVFIPAHTAKSEAVRPGDDITALGSAAWDGAAQYRWGSYRKREGTNWKYWFCLLPSRRTDAEAAIPRELLMDANGVLTLSGSADAGSSPKELKLKERRNAIVAFVSANEPTSKNRIHQAIRGGEKATFNRLVDSMHDDELWIGPKQQVWTYQGYLDHVIRTWRP